MYILKLSSTFSVQFLAKRSHNVLRFEKIKNVNVYYAKNVYIDLDLKNDC